MKTEIFFKKFISVNVPKNQQTILVLHDTYDYKSIDQMFYDNEQFVLTCPDGNMVIDEEYILAWADMPMLDLKYF